MENLILHVVDYDPTSPVNWLNAIFRYEKSRRGAIGSLEKAEIAWAPLLKLVDINLLCVNLYCCSMCDGYLKCYCLIAKYSRYELRLIYFVFSG